MSFSTHISSGARRALVGAALLLMLPANAIGVGSASTVSPRPLGMGGAFMAVDDRLASAAWNPAGIIPPGSTERTGVRAHINILGGPAIVRETGLLTGVESEQFTSLPAFEKLTVALGGVVKGISFRHESFAFHALLLEEHLDPQGLAESRGLADAEELLGAYYTSLAFAFRLAPTVSIGACEILQSGWDENGERDVSAGRAYGALLRPNETVTVGLTYFDLPGDFDHYRLEIEGLGSRTMNAGLAYRPVPGVLVTFDLRDLSEKHAETSLEPRMGFEWNLWGSGAVRAGAFREEDSAFDVLTLGLGAIPMSASPEAGLSFRGDCYVLNYAVLLRSDGAPRHLLSAMLHF